MILRTALATLRNREHDFILPAVKQNALRDLLLIGDPKQRLNRVAGDIRMT